MTNQDGLESIQRKGKMGRLPLEEHDGIALLQRVFEGSKKDGLCGTGVSVQQVCEVLHPKKCPLGLLH